MLDADPAGRAATMKVVHLFVEAELPCRIAQLRAKAARSRIPTSWRARICRSLQRSSRARRTAVEFYFEQVAATSAPTVPGRVAAIEEVAPLLRTLRDPLARDLYCDKLASLLKVDAGLVQRALRAAPARSTVERKMRDVQPAQRGAASPPSPSRLRHVAQRRISLTHYSLLAFLAQHPAYWPKVDASILKDDRCDRWLPRRNRAIPSTRHGSSTPVPPRSATPWPRRSAPTSLPATKTRTKHVRVDRHLDLLSVRFVFAHAGALRGD